ncbi:MAG: hypothetical protein HXL68_10765 [Dechloromonas agitata]|uniref:Uncharacterized protein n=1 Tax=Dechloromonas agitata TaxID=73030 RepID=A0A930G246_9RHOO|nr:hypothetical protein [Dechloromonas agitata]
MPYRLLILGIIAAALFGLGWLKGAGHVQDQWDAATSKQALQVATVEKEQAEATVRVVTEYVDRVKVVRQAGETIIKEVPVYVPAQADAACVVPRGFVRLHDAAAAGRLPQAAGAADALPAGIALSAVAGTVADNYERCHENTEQLKSLQEWIRAQEVAANE